MNKNIKKISFMLFVVIALLIGINYNKLISYAERKQFLDIEKYDLYTSQDSIYIGESLVGSGTGIYGDSSGVSYVNGTILAHVDKDGNLLSAYSNKGVYSSYYFFTGELLIGQTCEKTFENVGFEQEARGMFCYKYSGGLYDGGEDKLADIDEWEVISVNEMDAIDFCEMYEEKVSNSTICQRYSDYSGVTSSFNITNVIILKEYIPAEFTFSCDPHEIKYGEKTTCTFSVNTTSPIIKVKTKINSESLEIKDLTPSDNWEYKIDEDGYYIFETNTGISGEFTLTEIVLTPKKDELVETSVNLLDIEYTRASGESKYTVLKDDIKVTSDKKVEEETKEEPKEEANPDTTDLNILLLSIASILLISIIIIIKKAKTDI